MKTYTIELTGSEIAMICFALGVYTVALEKSVEKSEDRFQQIIQVVNKLNDATTKS